MADNFDDSVQINEHIEIKTSFGDGVAEPMLAAGTLLGAQFKVIYEIGSGGMGAVYKCEDIVTGRYVAVKVLTTGRLDAKVVSRFQREAKAIARLDNPHLVRLFSVGTSPEGKPFIVMELVEGRSISEALHADGPMEEKRVIEIALQICSALQSAHELGVVHRDLKPGNIILKRNSSRSEDIKIIDFGIAKVVDSNLTKATSTGELIGSPAYMSPEQVRGQEVDALTDQYSLGCVLFEMLTGQVPFASSTAIGVLMQHVNDTPTSLSEATLGRQKFSPTIESVIKRLLQKDPRDRFASMAECARALKNETVLPSRNEIYLSEKSPEQKKNKGIKIALLSALSIGTIALGSILAVSYLNSSPTANAPAKPDQLASVPPQTLHGARDDFKETAARQALIETNLSVRQTAQKAQLEELSFKDAEFSADNVDPLRNLRYIKVAHFERCGGIDYALKTILHRPLEFLSVSSCEPSLVVLRLIEQVPTIRALSLRSLALPPEMYDEIGRMSNLENLDLNHSEASEADLEKLAGLSKLVWLSIDGSKANKSVLTLRMPHLWKLSVRRTPISSEVIQKMNFPALTDLSLEDTEINDKAFLSLKRFKHLRTINIVRCKNVTPEAINQLKPLYRIISENAGDRRRTASYEENKGAFPIVDKALDFGTESTDLETKSITAQPP